MPRWTTILLFACVLEAAALCGAAAAQDGGVAASPVAARDLDRGSVLKAADIAVDVGAENSNLEIVGWVTRRVVSKGEPLRSPTIAPPELVRSGDAVQLVWSEGLVEIRLAGKAMNSAAGGERVLVRVDLKRRFEGVAESPGVVRLASHETSR